MNNEEQYFNFTLNVNELNLILNGLAELPFKIVNPIVQNLMQQYQAHLPQPAPAADNTQ